eukprot:496057_1
MADMASNRIPENIKSFQNIRDIRVIALILGVPRTPSDRHGNSLVHVKQTSVPRNSLPDGFVGVIHTPQPSPCTRNGDVQRGRNGSRGADDNAYKNHVDLQRVLPRAYSILRIFREHDGVCVAKHIVQGYYKFGGSAKDEDSNISTSGLFENAPLHKTDRVVVTEKSNGKAAVLTMFKFQGETYIFGGSKGQHYIAPLRMGLRAFDYLDHEYFAWQIFEVFFRIWNTLLENVRQHFCARLIGTDVDDGETACGEYEDGKHMVPMPLLPDGKLGPSDLKMFGLVRNKGAISPGETFCEDVAGSLEWFKSLGFPVTKFQIRSKQDVDRIKESLREGSMKEGYVLHYQVHNPKTGLYTTIAVEKYKLWWYIVIRLLREFMRGKENLNGFESKLWQRLKRRNSDYMQMSPERLQGWKALCVAFIKWFIQKGYRRNMDIIHINTSSRGMGTVWREFLMENPAIDDTFGTGVDAVASAMRNLKVSGNSEIKSHNSAQQQQQSGRTSTTKPTGYLVIFQGIPGIGKSTLTGALVAAVARHGLRGIGLEQDAFVAEHSLRRAGQACEKRFQEYTKSGEYDVVFLQRNNANYSQFSKYVNFARRAHWDIRVFTPRDMNTNTPLQLVCLQSILQRSVRKDHATFKDLELDKQFQITMSFLEVFTKPRPGGSLTGVHDIDWIMECDMSTTVSERARTFLAQYTRHIKSARTPWDAKPLNAKTVTDELELKTVDYQKLRRTPEDIASDVLKVVFEDSSKGSQAESGATANGHTAVVTQNNAQKPTQKSALSPSAGQTPSIGKSALFACLLLKDEDKPKLKALLAGQNLDLSRLTVDKFDHLTLIYQKKDTHRNLWLELMQMETEKRELCIIVEGIAYSPDSVACFTCRIRTEKGVKAGRSVLRLVESGHPHITAKLAPGQAPVESFHLLQRLSGQAKPDSSKPNERFFRLSTPLLLMAPVYVAHRRGGRNRPYHNKRNQGGRRQGGDNQRGGQGRQ